MKIINVASARPNFMKIAPILEEIDENHDEINAKLLHTGQHYDYEMSRIFFDELGIPTPDYYLGVGSGSHAEQTAKVMIEFEKVIKREKPDWVLVVGDVNPTMACTVVAQKMGIKVAHVEAGLRSYDRTMPEEINRVLTDSIADLLLTPSINANMNLVKEGITADKIHFVGNIMIDTLLKMRKRAGESTVLTDLGLKERDYCYVTLHRPSNVDNKDRLKNFVDILEETTRRLPIVWPVHPRSKNNAQQFGLWGRMEKIVGLQIIDAVGYLDNVKLMNYARLVMTDSGGIQEETTALGVPCLTVRDNTERPITIEEGTNTLVGTIPTKILKHVNKYLENDGTDRKELPKPLFWDGKTAGRIIQALKKY